MPVRFNRPAPAPALAMATVLVSALVTPGARGDTFITSNYPILSALQDTSNLGYTETRFSGYLNKPASDPDLYINAVSFVPGSNWDPAIPLNVPTDLAHDFGQSYTFGTAISGETNWYLDRLADVVGTVDSSIAPGVYDFSLDIVGGAGPAASDTLASLPLQLEIVPSLSFSIHATTGGTPVARGQGFQVSVTLTNDMTDRPLAITSYYVYVPTFNGPAGGFIDYQDFVGDWFNKSIDPGDSLTGPHTTYLTLLGIPGGTYTGGLGVIGGLHPGDNFSFQANPTVDITGGPALPGDANFDGLLNPDDFTLIDRGFARYNRADRPWWETFSWTDGDFDLDGDVDADDYLLLDTQYAQQHGLAPGLLSTRDQQFGPGYVAQLIAAVPEPSAAALVVTALPLLRRPRTARR